MIIGVPKEIKQGENRVAMTPRGRGGTVEIRPQVIVERGAGAGSGIADEDYEAAGANMAEDGRTVYERGELIVKVKEPEPHEAAWLRTGRFCLRTCTWRRCRS